MSHDAALWLAMSTRKPASLARRQTFLHNPEERWRPLSRTVRPSVQKFREEENSEMNHHRLHLAVTAALALALSASQALAQKKYDPGASATEIKVGQTMPFGIGLRENDLRPE